VECARSNIARAMAAEPKLLIADEAMAGLSHPRSTTSGAAVQAQRARRITVILIEHIIARG